MRFLRCLLYSLMFFLRWTLTSLISKTSRSWGTLCAPGIIDTPSGWASILKPSRSVYHITFSCFFSECIKLGSIHLVWHNMLENVFHDSNRLYKSIIHLSLHLGECIRRSRWRVVHVGRRPWSGQEHLQRLRPQCDDEKDGQPASCEFKKRKKSSNQFSINLFTCFFSDSRSPSRL